MFDGLKRAIASGLGREAGAAIGAAIAGVIFANAGVLNFLNTACSYLSSPEAMTAGFGGLGVMLACMAFGVKDKINVNAKMAVTAATAYDQGAQAQSTTDQSKVQAVAAAMKTADAATKQDKASIIAALKTGTF